MNHFDSIKRPNNISKNIIFYKDKTAPEYPLKPHIDSLRGFKNQGDSITTPNQHFDSCRSNKNHYVSGFHCHKLEGA